ncbi:MAG: GIY-YIG nuclease family protein [Halosimplex sp.]
MTDSRTPDPDHFVYVVRCRDDTLYTGYTTDVERRVREHDAGEGAKYTRGRTPVELVHVEAFDSQSAAMSREHEIKQRSRTAKDRLVADGGVPASLALPDSLLADDAR